MSCKCCCISCVFLFVLFAAPLITLLTLSYVGIKPRFYIQEIYIPSLNNSHSQNATNLNSSIFIDLKFKRAVAHIPIRYEDVNITLFYSSNRSSAVGSAVVPRFGQGKKKAVRRKAVVEARGLPWDDALRKISGGSTVDMAVELATGYSLKRCYDDGCFYVKPKPVVVAAEVRLDGSGYEVSKKAVRLH